MANGDGTVTMVLRLEAGETVASLVGASNAAKATAAAEKELAAAGREAAAAAAQLSVAQARLEGLAATRSPIEMLALTLRRTQTEIRALALATGDSEMAARASTAAQERFATQLALLQSKAQATGATLHGMEAAGAAAGRGGGMAAAGMANLGYQVSDVATQLAMGTNPFMIAIQQGPQAAMAIGQMGGASQALTTILGGLVKAGPAIEVVAIAVAAGAAAWAVYGNIQEEIKSGVDGVNLSMTEQAEKTRLTAAEVTKYHDAWKRFSDSATEVQGKIDAINGLVTAGESAGESARRKVLDSARDTLLAESKAVEGLKASALAHEDLSRSTHRTAEERALDSRAAMDQRAQLVGVTKTFQDHAKAVQDAADKAALLAEYNGVLSDSNKTLEERARGAREAVEALRRAQEAAADIAKLGGMPGLSTTESGASDAALQRQIAGVTTLVDKYQALAQQFPDMKSAYAAMQTAADAAIVDMTQSMRVHQQEADTARRMDAEWRREIDGAAVAFTNLDAAIAGFKDTDITTVIQDAAMAQADLAIALSRGQLSLEQFTAAAEHLSDSSQKAIATAQAGKAAGIAGTVAGGPQAVMGAVASSGPIGAIIVAIISFIKDAKNIGKEFTDFHVEIMDGIANFPSELPDIVYDALVRGTNAVSSMLPKLISGLITMIPNLIAAVIKAIPEIAKGFWVAFKDMLTPDIKLDDMWTNIKSPKQGQANAEAEEQQRAGMTGTVGVGTTSRTSRAVVQHFHGAFIGIDPTTSRKLNAQMIDYANVYGSAS